jgi:hypothetical protein
MNAREQQLQRSLKPNPRSPAACTCPGQEPLRAGYRQRRRGLKRGTFEIVGLVPLTTTSEDYTGLIIDRRSIK